MEIQSTLRNVFQRLGRYKNLVLTYQITMALLSLAAVGMIIVEYSTHVYDYKLINTLILIVFSLDYFIRLYIAEDKAKFIKSNVIDLIAIIPLNSLFQGARFIKLLKLLRILVFLIKFRRYVDKFVKTNNFHYVLWLTLITIFLGALGMYLIEQKSFADSLWWSFVTATTVGYGDISPTTPIARIIAVILMITGISFIGMLTGTIATYFIRKPIEDHSYKNEAIQTIRTRLIDFDKLSIEDVKGICIVLEALKANHNKQSGG